MVVLARTLVLQLSLIHIYDALLRQFGNEIEKVYPVWLVKEGDDFTYPKRKGKKRKKEVKNGGESF